MSVFLQVWLHCVLPLLAGCKERDKFGAPTSSKSPFLCSVATPNDLCVWRLKGNSLELRRTSPVKKCEVIRRPDAAFLLTVIVG
ncbi:hypothetical protein TNCV_2726891 [Trichonephila clavipes]|nr:hypothetical protein TNCV_2726891 [Trichonephila clavipes]